MKLAFYINWLILTDFWLKSWIDVARSFSCANKSPFWGLYFFFFFFEFWPLDFICTLVLWTSTIIVFYFLLTQLRGWFTTRTYGLRSGIHGELWAWFENYHARGVGSGGSWEDSYVILYRYVVLWVTESLVYLRLCCLSGLEWLNLVFVCVYKNTVLCVFYIYISVNKYHILISHHYIQMQSQPRPHTNALVSQPHTELVESDKDPLLIKEAWTGGQLQGLDETGSYTLEQDLSMRYMASLCLRSRIRSGQMLACYLSCWVSFC